jgi:hypothetical protein
LGDGNTNFYRLVNRTSLQQDPLDYDLRPRDSYLTCAQDDNDRLIGKYVCLTLLYSIAYKPPVIIVNEVSSRQTFRTNKSRGGDIPFQNPRAISQILAGKSYTSLSDGSRETFAKLLVLDFFLASIYLQPVDHYAPIIYPQLSEKEVLKYSHTKNPHLQVPLGLFEPRLSAKSTEAFKEIEDAEGILRSVNNLVDSIRFVMADLKENNITTTQQRRLKELEGLCSERSGNAKRALEALNRQLDYLTKRHSIREAKSIKILTILASLYLPLSLSASILSVQTPFRAVAHNKTKNESDGTSNQDLEGTNLLFDFFGVFIVLATGTVFILYGIRSGLWLKSHGLGMVSKNFRGPFSIFYYGRRWKFGGKRGKWFGRFCVFTAYWIGAGLCITLLTTFIVGMLRTAESAWHMAQWMFATYLSVSGAFLVACAVVYRYLRRKALGSR